MLRRPSSSPQHPSGHARTKHVRKRYSPGASTLGTSSHDRPPPTPRSSVKSPPSPSLESHGATRRQYVTVTSNDGKRNGNGRLRMGVGQETGPTVISHESRAKVVNRRIEIGRRRGCRGWRNGLVLGADAGGTCGRARTSPKGKMPQNIRAAPKIISSSPSFPVGGDRVEVLRWALPAVRPSPITAPHHALCPGCPVLLLRCIKSRLRGRIPFTETSDEMTSGGAAPASPAPAPPSPQAVPAEEEQAVFNLLDKLDAFRVEGRDKRGRRVLRIIGKFFPGGEFCGAARVVKPGVLSRYLEERIFPELLGKKDKGGPFVVVYVHTYVERLENFPGVAALRSIYESVAPAVRDNLEAVYFVHPGLQSRLFFATFGRFLFSAGLYGKLRYVSRLEFLWEHIRRGEVDVPEFVYDHDEELEQRPLMDYGLESDHHHHRAYDAPAMDTAASMYSLRCIS